MGLYLTLIFLMESNDDYLRHSHPEDTYLHWYAMATSAIMVSRLAPRFYQKGGDKKRPLYNLYKFISLYINYESMC